jgi:hypothetical protein
MILIKNKKSSWVVALLIILSVVGSIGLAGWYIGQRASEDPSSCSNLRNNLERYKCYSSDSEAQLLGRAIAEKKPELCDGINHIFIPHDVMGDINKGIIGSFVYGDEAIRNCRAYVEFGYAPGGG